MMITVGDDLKQVTGMSKQDPKIIARKFCKENKLGSKTMETIAEMVK